MPIAQKLSDRLRKSPLPRAHFSHESTRIDTNFSTTDRTDEVAASGRGTGERNAPGSGLHFVPRSTGRSTSNFSGAPVRTHGPPTKFGSLHPVFAKPTHVAFASASPPSADFAPKLVASALAGAQGRAPLPRCAAMKTKGGRGRRGKFKHVESDATESVDSGRRSSVVALTKRRDFKSRRGA